MAEGMVTPASGMVDEAQTPGMVDEAQEVSAEDPELSPEEMPTPEEQEQYDSAMKMASEIMYADDTASDAVLEQLRQGDVPDAVASVTSFIITQIDEAYKGELGEVIIIPIADEISDLLLELAAEAGIFELKDGEIVTQTKGAVMQILFEDYGIDEEDLEGMLQGVTPGDIEELHKQFGGGE